MWVPPLFVCKAWSLFRYRIAEPRSVPCQGQERLLETMAAGNTSNTSILAIKYVEKALELAFQSSISEDKCTADLLHTKGLQALEHVGHTHLLRHLILSRGAKSLLEIGCGHNVNHVMMTDLKHVSLLEIADCVDPVMGGTHRMTSNDFFKNNNKQYDVIFIDGDHCAQQVRQDIFNALDALSPQGIILLHDVFPAFVGDDGAFWIDAKLCCDGFR